MKKLLFLIRCFVNFMILCATPGLVANPNSFLDVYDQTDTKLAFTYDDIMTFVDRIEKGDYDNSYSDVEKTKINQLIAVLASQGALPDISDKTKIENEIAILLDHKENPLEIAFNERNFEFYSTLLLDLSSKRMSYLRRIGWVSNAWERTKKFISDHKKEIAIGAIVVVATAAVTVVAVCVSGASAAAIAAGEVACAGSVSQTKKKKTEIANLFPHSMSKANELAVMEINSEEIQEKVNEMMGDFLESIPNQISHDEKALGDSMDSLSLIEHHRQMTAYCMHEFFNAVADRYSFVPWVCDGLNKVVEKHFPGKTLGGLSGLFMSGIDVNEHYEKLVLILHEGIDFLYGTSHAKAFTPEAKAENMLHLSNFLWLFDAKKMVKKLPYFLKDKCVMLKNAEKAKLTIGERFKAFYKGKFNFAEEYLKPYRGVVFDREDDVKKLIKRVGIPVFSRPKGIPKDYEIQVSKYGAGIKYIHPKNDKTYVRVMPGKPHAKWPAQRKPYVVNMKHGKYIDKYGNMVNKKTAEAHIPLEEFVYE
ncbi:MAG: hypothetical protein S4CHLAM20_07740 [Chlamydiia bacterium]|nr:hypothetical protein [Chlamydiia bacterium]